MAQLQIRDLSFTYPQCGQKTLSDISFTVEQGQLVTICGSTGSGKTTLLRCLKRQLTPLGEMSGQVLYNGVPLTELDERTAACSAGYVMQRPEEQIVTDKVWHELAFGLENLGLDRQTIRRRTAEMACYFGIGHWFDRDTAQLSGGQKQLLNLASVMVMNPDILILDEPTAQLDPIAAADFLSTIRRLCRDYALTVIIAEHRLEDILPDCDRLLVMDNGRLIDYDTPSSAASRLSTKSALLAAMPAAVRLHNALAGHEERHFCPLSVREGRQFITSGWGCDIPSLPEEEYNHSGKPALEFSGCFFRYERTGPDVLRGLELTVYEGEAFFILGGNGSGKTTALHAAAGLLRCCAGSVKVLGRKLNDYRGQALYNGTLSLLSQDPQTLFLCATVAQELEGIEPDIIPFDFTPLMERHPYDLSGGQQQMLALAKVLASKPKVLLLDEPTKGLDADSKNKIAGALAALKAGGVTVVAVTHDVEFAAACADRCALFFRGEVTSVGTPRQFFSENSFYTTAVSRMTRGHYHGAVTDDDVLELCRINGRRKSL